MKVAAYVHKKYAKQTYAVESHNVRAWHGFSVILDAVKRGGIEYQYAGMATIHEYDVVLVSITSDCDWWTFLSERVRWKSGKYKIVIGGAGVLNVRPFLQYVDCFVFGRGENIIVPLLREIEAGGRYKHESVCWSDEFDVSKNYFIAQVDKPYEYECRLENSKTFKEESIGCPYKCYFCGYTWQRKYIGDGSFTAGSGSMSAGSGERTIIDLLKLEPQRWQEDALVMAVGLDGMSERLRFMVNKKISREMFKRFLSGLTTLERPHQIKIYNIVGYPTETENDWREVVQDIKEIDMLQSKSEKQWSLLFHFTPFRAMPATPLACWPMSYVEYRYNICKELKEPQMPGNVFFQGNKFWAVEGLGTDCLARVIQSAIILRGEEADAESIVRVATSRKFQSASAYEMRKTLEGLFDVEKLFGAYMPETLPTRYLKSYIPIKYKN